MHDTCMHVGAVNGKALAQPIDGSGAQQGCTKFMSLDDVLPQEYVTRSRVRNLLRLAVVAGVLGLVAIFVVVKYSTDDSLKGATQTTREFDVGSISQTKVKGWGRGRLRWAAPGNGG